MKGKRKKVLRISVFCAIVLIGFIFANSLFQPIWYSWGTIYTAKGFYAEPKNTVETVFVGSSVSVSGMNPMELYDEYGLCSYNLSSVKQPMLGSYYWVEEAYRLHPETLKTVVLDVSQLRDTSSESYHHKCFDYMRPSNVKYRAIKEYTKGDVKKMLEFFIPIAAYHDRWNDLNYSDLRYYVDDLVTGLKGYYFDDKFYMSENVDLAELSNSILDENATMEETQFTEVSMKYFNKLVSFCEKNDIELVLTKVPTILWDSTLHNEAQALADKHGLVFLDYNFSPLYDELNYVFPFDNFDNQHLNYYGACKLTSLVGEYLVENCDVTDVRGLEKYEYMEEQFAEYKTRVRNQLSMQNAQTITDYLDQAVAKDNAVMIAVKGSAAGALSEEERNYFSELGLEKLSKIKGNQSYIAKIDKAGKPYEKIIDNAVGEVITDKGKLGRGVSYEISSGPTPDGDMASILVRNIERAKNSRGLNIAVYSYTTDEVVDSTCFDTQASRSRDVYNVGKAEEVANIDESEYVDLNSIAGQVQLYMQREDDYLKSVKLKSEIGNDLFAFLDEYMSDDDNIIIMAGNSDISRGLTSQDRSELASYGLRKYANIGYGQSYIAIIEDGCVTTEISKSDVEPIAINRMGLYVKSAGAYAGGTCSIKVNGVEQAFGSRGLSVVVYNQAKNRVIDHIKY